MDKSTVNTLESYGVCGQLRTSENMDITDSTSPSSPLLPGVCRAAKSRSGFRASLCEWRTIPPEALVAQLDRALDYESRGREFESLRARQYNQLVIGNSSIGFLRKVRPCRHHVGTEYGESRRAACRSLPARPPQRANSGNHFGFRTECGGPPLMPAPGPSFGGFASISTLTASLRSAAVHAGPIEATSVRPRLCFSDASLPS
jgi:hypothetical protein